MRIKLNTDLAPDGSDYDSYGPGQKFRACRGDITGFGRKPAFSFFVGLWTHFVSLEFRDA